MKNGDIFYTFDMSTLHVMKMCTTEAVRKDCIFAVCIRGGTNTSNVRISAEEAFSSPEDARQALLDAVVRRINLNYDWTYGQDNKENNE